ncbi:unnamed protein product [Amoebophrya sp. A120]|nr:unnamed protein product [Amoebophrya sp. A120]|eukprot:GSA120T00023312001.1
MDNLSPLLPWLYIGDKHDAKDLENLNRQNIKYIVNATPSKNDGGVANFYEKQGSIKYLRLPMQDNASENLKQWYEQFFAFIEQCRIRDDGSLLVHCNQGVSRSVSLVIAYLLKYFQFADFEACLREIKRKCRVNADPNDAFRRQLEDFTADLRCGKEKYEKEARKEEQEKQERKRKMQLQNGGNARAIESVHQADVENNNAKRRKVDNYIGPAALGPPPAPRPQVGPMRPGTSTAGANSHPPATASTIGPAMGPALPPSTIGPAAIGPQRPPASPTAHTIGPSTTKILGPQPPGAGTTAPPPQVGPSLQPPAGSAANIGPALPPTVAATPIINLNAGPAVAPPTITEANRIKPTSPSTRASLSAERGKTSKLTNGNDGHAGTAAAAAGTTNDVKIIGPAGPPPP